MRTVKRTICRHVDNYAIELREEGIAVRLFGHAKKSAKVLTFARLASILGVRKARGRDQAFDEPIGDWTPKPGDGVFVSRRVSGGLCRGTVISFVAAVPEPEFVVQLAKGRTKVVGRHDLRPGPQSRKNKEHATPLLKD